MHTDHHKNDSHASTARDDRVEALLAGASSAGQIEATRLRNEAIELSLPLALAVARQYADRGIDVEDLVQVASLGLVKAAHRYRPGAGPSFAAFAFPTMTGEVKRHFRDHGTPVRPPRRVQENRALVSGIEADLEQRMHRAPTAAEVAAACELSIADVKDAKAASARYRCASLDAPAPGSNGSVNLGDTLKEPSDTFTAVDDHDTLQRAISSLRDRERLILKLRFVDELNQSAIGQRVGISQMQISRILAGVFRQIRDDVTDSMDPRLWA